MTNSKKYQSHIDGLRAVAVLSVIFYHFGQASFSGGYVGVDVFFVISGFLITRLILDEINDTGEFNFKRFYIRRIRRLFPALLVTLTISLALAIALFPPEQFQGFGRSLSAAVFSVSNIFFWTGSGYFDVNSHAKPLLHTWSLSVEEQYYLFWPALLWFVTQKSNRKWWIYIISVIGIASLVLNHIWVVGNFDAKYSSSIFYLTPFRIFELGIGAMATFAAPFFSSKRWLNELGMALGLILIAYSIFVYTDKIVFPYYYALLPCISAALVILSPNSRFFGSVLTNPIAVGTGLISYSMYLVHWPVLVFYEYYKFEELHEVEYIGLLAVTILFAVLMYFCVERPFRRYAPSRLNPAPQKGFVLSSISVMIIIGLVGLQIGTSAGWDWRHPNSLSATVIAEGKSKRYDLTRKGCQVDRLDDRRYCNMSKSIQILVFGNSHEPDGYNAFSTVYGDNPAINLISFGTTNHCNIQLDRSGPFSQVSARNCDKRVDMLNNVEFISSLDGLVYSSNHPFAVNKKNEWHILAHLKSINENLPVVVMGGYLNTLRECSELINHFHTFDACKDSQFVSNNPFDERENTRLDDAVDIDYLALFGINVE